MSYSAAQFEKAVAIVGDLPKDGPVQPSQEDKLFFYAHFKQAKQGDNETTRPGMLDFVGKAKWDAWTGVKGTSTEDAQSKYVARFLALLEKDSGAESQKNKEAVLNA